MLGLEYPSQKQPSIRLIRAVKLAVWFTFEISFKNKESISWVIRNSSVRGVKRWPYFFTAWWPHIRISLTWNSNCQYTVVNRWENTQTDHPTIRNEMAVGMKKPFVKMDTREGWGSLYLWKQQLKSSARFIKWRQMVLNTYSHLHPWRANHHLKQPANMGAQWKETLIRTTDVPYLLSFKPQTWHIAGVQ